jgi:hypothetical protein
MTVSGSHQPVRASFSPRLTTTPRRFGDSEVMVKQPPPGQLFGSPVSAFGCPETGFWARRQLRIDVKFLAQARAGGVASRFRVATRGEPRRLRACW